MKLDYDGAQSIAHIHALGFCLSAAIAVVLFNGCRGNQGPERVVVQGTVTYNGKPVPNGTLCFVPTAPSVAPTAGTQIVDGRYTLDYHGGVPVGTHTIQIDMLEEMSSVPRQSGWRPPSKSGSGRLRKVSLSERCKQKSQMQVTIEPGSGGITRDFNLTD